MTLHEKLARVQEQWTAQADATRKRTIWCPTVEILGTPGPCSFGETCDNKDICP